MKNIKPMREFLLVEEDAMPETSEGGIVLANGGEQTRTATVKEVGPDVTNIKVGDVVTGHWGGVIKMTFGVKDYFLINQHDIFAVIEEAE